MEKHKKRQYKNGLQTTLKFTDEDLVFNRQGYLSEAQKAEQAKHLSFDMKIMLLPAILILLIGAGSIASGERVYIVFSIILLGLGAFAAFQMHQDFLKFLKTDKLLKQAESKLGLKSYTDKYGRLYGCITLSEQSFYISIEAYNSLRNDAAEARRWLIYYLPDTKRIISAEALDND